MSTRAQAVTMYKLVTRPYLYLPALITLVMLFLLLKSFNASAQVLELPPLVDTSQPTQHTQKRQTQQTMVLRGTIKTLDVAIREERDTVDWYRWYMEAREYISFMGGLRCPAGTSIVFHKNGLMEAQTFSRPCMVSVMTKRFPLPEKTSLSAIILPVRPGEEPPASPEELERRIRESSKLMHQHHQ